jgi:hypothetical protein
MKRKYESRLTSYERLAASDEFFRGSALILTVVLTSLLAIVGVLFVMASRVDNMATSAISENKELDLAIDTVVARISQELASDVPGVAGQEYYDYPDANNTWLAVLEPYQFGTDYYWRQISDLYNRFDPNLAVLQAAVVPEYQDGRVMAEGLIADADGDGVADSRWVIVPDMSSSKGRPIYAAIRVIGNGGMLNVNTAYKLDPGDPNATIFDIGSPGQLQINLMALAGRPGNPPTLADEIALLAARANYGPNVTLANYLRRYEQDFIWRYGEPNGLCTPFDISDELELRYRFLLNHAQIDTRLEQWGGQFRRDTLSTPVTSGGQALDAWFKRACDDGTFDPNYAYRHIATTYNMDRIINPAGLAFNGGKMVNVNIADANLIYAAIRRGLLDADPNFRVLDPNGLAAQLAVNIVDLRDSDAQMTVLPTAARTYYGFEAQPFISEVAFRINGTNADVSANNHFAVELYNPFDVDIPLGDFRLELRRQTGALVGAIDLTGHAVADGSRFVVTNSAAASNTFGVSGIMSTGGGKEDPQLILAAYDSVATDPPTYELRERYDVYLIRRTSAADIYIDKQQTQDGWFDWETVRDTDQFYARPDNDWNVVYQTLVAASNTLGATNGLSGGRKNYNFYNFINAMGYFVSVGDVARALRIGPSTDPNDMIGVRLAAEPGEEFIRLDLRSPAFARIFQYLTVFDPATDAIDNDGDGIVGETNANLTPEFKVKGRINVNTAPWFVIAQLPWVQPAIAQAIVAFRDTMAAGFESISELTQVPEMGYYASDPAHASVDLDGFPDLTPSDGAEDDFEERDVIFSRISNLVTVRSDVFTAYILVRVGADGPQKRVIAILDRSDVYSGDGRVKIIALHPVPDPR